MSGPRTLPPGRGRRAVLAAAGLALLGALGITAPWSRPARAGDATQTQVESDLTCQCGCGLTVHSCNHLNCGSGIPLKKEIAEQIGRGGSREEILDYFQGKYGEKILSSPTATGFNLAAWTVPFVVLGVGLLLVGLVLSRWRRGSRGAGAPAAAGVPGEGLDAAGRARLQSALEDFDRRS